MPHKDVLGKKERKEEETDIKNINTIPKRKNVIILSVCSPLTYGHFLACVHTVSTEFYFDSKLSTKYHDHKKSNLQPIKWQAVTETSNLESQIIHCKLQISVKQTCAYIFLFF